jgi:hypothetical protein
MKHLARGLRIPALAFCSAFLAPAAAAQDIATDASVRVLDSVMKPVPADSFVLRDAQGLVLTTAPGPDGAITLMNVGRKLTIEFTPKGLKQRSYELVLENAPEVFLTLLVDPLTGRVKSITQKPHFPETDPDRKIRVPGSGQVGLVIPPVNDDCAAPSVIFNGITAWSTVDALTDGPADCLGQIYRDIWYDHTATSTGTLTVSTCHQSTLDTKIAIYDGLICPPGPPIGCNDDFGACQSFTSIATAPVVAGRHYLIRLGAFGSTATGTGTLTITPPTLPPIFDQCATAPWVDCDSSTTFSNAAGSTDPTDPAFSCRFSGAAQGFGTSWFRFTAIGPRATLDTNGSLTSDTLLAVYSGTCGALTEIGCDDDGGDGFLSMVTVDELNVGQTYYVQVAGYGAGNVGTNTLNLTCVVDPPLGDVCTDAISIPCNDSATVDNSVYTTDPTDPAYSCRFGRPAQGVGTVWYRFVATRTSARIRTDNSLGVDTLLALYGGTCGALIELCCSDNEGVGLLSELCCEWLVPGSTYYIQASSFSSFDVGEITVSVECPCPAPPANDDCEDAQPLELPASVTFDNSFATDDVVVPCDVSAGPFKNVWYEVAGTGNTLTATTCRAGTEVSDTIISVFCKGCGELLCVGSNDDDCVEGGPIFASTVSWCSQAGADYLVTVGNFSSVTTPGLVQLDVSAAGPACVADVACWPVGACCLRDGSCVVVTPAECAALGGEYQGDDTQCAYNAVADGGFESGIPAGAWAAFPASLDTPLSDASYGFGGGTGPHTGRSWAWFGGAFEAGESSLQQSVTIPVEATTLDFFLEIPVSSKNGADFLEVLIDGHQVFLTLESDRAGPGYRRVSVPLGAFADGGLHSLEFHSLVTGSSPSGPALSNFFVDDVAIDSPVNHCPQPAGACFLADGWFVLATEEECAVMGGVYVRDTTRARAR